MSRKAAPSLPCPAVHLGLHAVRAPQPIPAHGPVAFAGAASLASRAKIVCNVAAPSASPEDVAEEVELAPAFVPAPTHLPRPDPLPIEEVWLLDSMAIISMCV